MIREDLTPFPATGEYLVNGQWMTEDEYRAAIEAQDFDEDDLL